MFHFLSQPNSTSTRVGVDKVISWSTPHHHHHLNFSATSGLARKLIFSIQPYYDLTIKMTLKKMEDDLNKQLKTTSKKIEDNLIEALKKHEIVWYFTNCDPSTLLCSFRLTLLRLSRITLNIFFLNHKY